MGFCDDAALSRNTSGLPCGVSLRMGNSARMRAVSAGLNESDDSNVGLETAAFTFSLRNLDRNDAVGDVHRVGAHRSDRGQTDDATRRHVEAGAVARALDLVADELALPQRAAVVRADVVDGIDVAAVVAKRDAAALNLHHLDLAFGNLVSARDLHHLSGHVSAPPRGSSAAILWRPRPA